RICWMRAGRQRSRLDRPTSRCAGVVRRVSLRPSGAQAPVPAPRPPLCRNARDASVGRPAMCGIVSVIGLPAADVSAGVVRKMTAAVHHRGPDDAGTAFFSRGPAGWQPCAETDPSWSVALGCTRLSILDLSAAGHMPMAYGDRLWIAYNG